MGDVFHSNPNKILCFVSQNASTVYLCHSAVIVKMWTGAEGNIANFRRNAMKSVRILNFIQKYNNSVN